MTTATGSAKGESGPTQTVVAGERWNSRPKLAMAVGATLRVLPAVVGAIAVWVATRTLPRPSGWWIVAWWLGLGVIAQGTVWFLNRWTARLLPMSMLLRLSLVFPDKAPSRVATALRSGNVEKLNREVAGAVDNGLPLEINEAIRTALSMVKTLSIHDKGTRGHSERVRAYAEVISEELGLSVEFREKVRWGAILHDIGKLSVPAEILNLPGRPTPEQWDILRSHPAEGARMLAPLADWLGDAFHACDHHHERWDGKGYPYGLAGDAISLTGRIVSVADAFAVMTMARSYKKPYSIGVARRELLKGAGSQFDPTVVRAMLAVSVGRMNRIAGPMAAAVNLPLIGRLLGPMVAPVVTFAPSVPSFVRVGAVALMTTSAGVTPMETRPVPWQSEVASTTAAVTTTSTVASSETKPPRSATTTSTVASPPSPETKPPRSATTTVPTDTTPPIIATTIFNPKETSPPVETKPPTPAPTAAPTVAPTTAPSSETTPPPTTAEPATTVPETKPPRTPPLATTTTIPATTTTAPDTKPPRTPPLATTTTAPASETK